MSQITIRDIPEKFEAFIRKRAKREGISLGKVVNEMLEEASGLRGKDGRYRDLGAFAGSWTRAEAVRAILEEAEEIVVPVIVAGELLSGFMLGDRYARNAAALSANGSVLSRDARFELVPGIARIGW